MGYHSLFIGSDQILFPAVIVRYFFYLMEGSGFPDYKGVWEGYKIIPNMKDNHERDRLKALRKKLDLVCKELWDLNCIRAKHK